MNSTDSLKSIKISKTPRAVNNRLGARQIAVGEITAQHILCCDYIFAYRANH